MGKIWLITGSSRGLGRALTEAVLATGEQVVATARKPEQLDDLVQTYGGQLRAVALDVTDTAASRQAVQAAVDEFGGLDVVANNAGYANSAPIEETSDADFRAQIETNLYLVAPLRGRGPSPEAGDRWVSGSRVDDGRGGSRGQPWELAQP